MNRAGQESFLMNILRSADLDKYEIWFSVNTDYVGDFEEEIKAIGGHVFHNPYCPSLKQLKKYTTAFKGFLRQEGPFDVVHCHVFYFSAFLLKAAFDEHIPIRVMHSHSTSDGYENTLKRKLYRKIALKLINKYSTEEVACGVDAYESFYNRKCPGDSKILNNSIFLDDYNEAKYNIVNLKRELQIPLVKTVFVSVARFLPVKNHSKIIGIFEQYHNEINANSILLLVGEGPLIDKIRKLVVEKKLEDNVVFMGIRSDVNMILMCSNLFLMPSLHEGLPVSLLEAQAAGVTCIISDTITKAIDMDLNLIEWCSLDENDIVWAKKCKNAVQKSKQEFDFRKRKIEKKGYSLSNVWKKLEDIYGS